MFDNLKIDSWQKGVLYLVTIAVLAGLYFLAKKKVHFSIRVLIGLVLGLSVGLIFGSIASVIRPIGQLYTRMIQMIVIPLVFTAIIKSFTSMHDTNKLKKIGLKTIFWLLSTTAIATVIGLLFAYFAGIGKGFDISIPDGWTPRNVTAIEQVILDFFPSNVFSSIVNNAVIPVIVFALFVSIAIIVESKRKPEQMKTFKDFNESVNRIMNRITKFVIAYTPYAVFAFMAHAAARNDFEVLKLLGWYILIVYAAMIFHFIFVQLVLVRLVGRVSPIQFIKNFYPAQVVAFTTQSSYGTMPITIKSMTNRMGISERVANFVGSIGANVGMNACGGIFPAAVAIFTANAYGIELTVAHYAILVLTTTIASIGIAGVPGVATIAATVTLSAVGLPLEGIALIAGVDALIDMGRTAVNVTGAGVTGLLVARSEKEFDIDKFNEKNTKESALSEEA